MPPLTTASWKAFVAVASVAAVLLVVILPPEPPAHSPPLDMALPPPTESPSPTVPAAPPVVPTAPPPPTWASEPATDWDAAGRTAPLPFLDNVANGKRRSLFDPATAKKGEFQFLTMGAAGRTMGLTNMLMHFYGVLAMGAMTNRVVIVPEFPAVAQLGDVLDLPRMREALKGLGMVFITRDELPALVKRGVVGDGDVSVGDEHLASRSTRQRLEKMVHKHFFGVSPASVRMLHGGGGGGKGGRPSAGKRPQSKTQRRPAL